MLNTEDYSVNKRIVFMGCPAFTGNYTHFSYLRNGLGQSYEFFLVGFNFSQCKAHFLDDCYVKLEGFDPKEKANFLLDFVIKYNINVIFPMNSPIAVSLIPYFPKDTKVIQIVNSDTLRVYKYVTEHIEYISKLICISRKQLNYLSKKLSKKNQQLLKLIPHGVKINNEITICNRQGKLKIGFLGRIHQGHKNVLLIPEILKKLNFDFEFHVCGDGPDRDKFFKKLGKNKIIFHNHGIVPNEELNKYLKTWDVLLFPSFVEGFPFTLIEAMNNEVLPISNFLPGITDMIIEHQESGFLVKNNKVSDYVEILEALNKNRTRLHRLKEKARKRVNEKFNLEDIIFQYQEVIEEVLSGPKKLPSKNFKDWKPYKEFKPSIWKRILNRIKT
jgi:glycosyltransferase involved in cell wall biosynthesis